MGAIVYNRLNDEFVQQIPTLVNVRMDARHKYVKPYPDTFDVTVRSFFGDFEIEARIGEEFQKNFPHYEVRVTNYLKSEADFDGAFEDAMSFPNTEANEFIDTSYMLGDVPNTLCITGRYPRAVKELEGITSNLAESGNHCLVTQEIDIAGSTSDGLGRSSFTLYWQDAYKEYIKDSTNLARIPNSLGDYNVTGKSSLVVPSSGVNLLRAFISTDNGNSYTEITSLTSISFPDRKDRVRIAWVNPSNIDIHLLTYTLMY